MRGARLPSVMSLGDVTRTGAWGGAAGCQGPRTSPRRDHASQGPVSRTLAGPVGAEAEIG